MFFDRYDATNLRERPVYLRHFISRHRLDLSISAVLRGNPQRKSMGGYSHRACLRLLTAHISYYHHIRIYIQSVSVVEYRR